MSERDRKIDLSIVLLFREREIERYLLIKGGKEGFIGIERGLDGNRNVIIIFKLVFLDVVFG